MTEDFMEVSIGLPPMVTPLLLRKSKIISVSHKDGNVSIRIQGDDTAYLIRLDGNVAAESLYKQIKQALMK